MYILLCCVAYFALSIDRAWIERGLVDRAWDLKPDVTQGCGFELRQELSKTEVRPLSKEPNPQKTAPCAAVSAAHCSKCVCTWMG